MPYNWPYVDTNYGTSILIFSNNVVLNSIKVLAGSNHTVNFGSYVRQRHRHALLLRHYRAGSRGELLGRRMPTSPMRWVTPVCGGQTEFQCIGGRLDLYGVLKDGAGTHSKLVKSGNNTLNLTGDLVLGHDANTYTGGTIVNAGPIKMAKLPGVNCHPGRCNGERHGFTVDEYRR